MAKASYTPQRIGPFKVFADNAIAELSRNAKNVRSEPTEQGTFILFDLPEGEPIWETARAHWAALPKRVATEPYPV